jgi:hypothetical protein
MSAKVKKNLLDKLTETHLATRTTLDKADMEMPVYADSGWRVREILGHTATWNQQVAISVKAFCKGSEYLIPDLDEEEVDFNESAVAEQKKLSAEQVIAEWVQAYNELSEAVQEVPDDQFPGDILFPWGDERGSIIEMVEYMIEHEIEHKNEIEKAMQA